MLTAEARVETARPGRYLAQLGRHLSNKGRHLGNDKGRYLRHRPSGDPGDSGDSGDHARRGLAEQVQAEPHRWSMSV